jgi:hypothetical protein
MLRSGFTLSSSKLSPATTPLWRGALPTDQCDEAMSTAADYRRWAEECFEWARQASDESERKEYAIWLEYAARAERSGQSRRQNQK